MDKSCAWSTASVIKLSAESAVPCCNFCWWWTRCKQILPSCPAPAQPCPACQVPRSARSALYADGSGRRRGDNCKHISWGSDLNRLTALASKKSPKQTGKHTQATNQPKPTSKTQTECHLKTGLEAWPAQFHLHNDRNCHRRQEWEAEWELGWWLLNQPCWTCPALPRGQAVDEGQRAS